MDERLYRKMGVIAGGTIAIGSCVLATGIACGVLLLVNGAKLLKHRRSLLI